MTLLAIETATDMVGVALVRGDGGSAERLHVGGRAHAELLIPSIEEVCAASGCTVADVEVIAVDLGPGLFTGLRVGVATAKALGQALSVGLIGVSSLDILAAAAIERVQSGGKPWSGVVVPVIDARRGEVFTAAYVCGASPSGGELAGDVVDLGAVRHDRSGPITPDTLESWLLELVAHHRWVTVVGDGAVRYAPQLAVHTQLDLGGATELSAPPPLALAHLALARLARGVAPAVAGDLVPDYRRPADARINWEQRAPRAVRAGVARPTHDQETR